MVRALNEQFEVEVLLPPMPQHAGAYGAALLAMEEADLTDDPEPEESVSKECHR
jgi:activator of 2-hydroxyglutaryl-CoA dehydratase